MRENRRKKLWLDITIMMLSGLGVAAVWYFGMPGRVVLMTLIAALFVIVFFLIDCMKQSEEMDGPGLEEQAVTAFAVHELMLLNEEEKPIRSWNLNGRTAMIIGRRYKDTEVDVDLSDCEYHALISVQHAVMNYCLDSWYIEDLGCQNEIQIKKADDGKCYQVAASRPCRVSAGDIIYIAKTKLLFT